jgi:hypothetical protein
VHPVLGCQSALRVWVAAVLLCLPVFFAAISFVPAIQTEPRPPAALGSNVLGALEGGMLEYSSMAVGFHPLYLFALGPYTLAWFDFSGVRQVGGPS